MLLLRFFLLYNGDTVYKFHAFVPTQDSYREYVMTVMKVPRKRLSTKVITKTFLYFSAVMDKERLDLRINRLCGLPGAEVIIKR
jgi:hypothetical protein